MSRCHRVTPVLGTLSCMLAIAACGSASTYSTSGSASPSSNDSAGFVKFAECMRAHGIPISDPKGGQGIQLTSGTNPFSPAFKSAQAVCRKDLPGGGPTTGPPSAQAKLLALQTSECMRRHGVTGFPDPLNAPPSSPNGYSAILNRGGAVIAVPDTINTQSPVYLQAAKACNFGS